jgi:hypothetical protein
MLHNKKGRLYFKGGFARILSTEVFLKKGHSSSALEWGKSFFIVYIDR